MFGEEFAGIHTMGSVMGTSIHAARLLLVETEIAGGCLGVDFRDFLSRMHKIIYLHIKRKMCIRDSRNCRTYTCGTGSFTP